MVFNSIQMIHAANIITDFTIVVEILALNFKNFWALWNQ